MYRGNYSGWGYSPLDRITPANVKKLVPVWTFSTGVTEGHQSPPIVNNGIMFVTTPQQQVFALNAKTGDLLWRYKKDLPEDLLQLHPTNRGVALWEDRAYVGTVDTDKIRGHHQYHWNDSWDWDEVSTPLLIDFRKDGRTIKGLVHPGRNGYLWRLERLTDGIKFVDARPFVVQEVFTGIDPVSGRPSYDSERKPRTGAAITFCPGLWGGKDWTPAGYNPKTHYLYIPANENLCSTLVGQPKPDPYEPGKLYLGIERPKTSMS